MSSTQYKNDSVDDNDDPPGVFDMKPCGIPLANEETTPLLPHAMKENHRSSLRGFSTTNDTTSTVFLECSSEASDTNKKDHRRRQYNNLTDNSNPSSSDFDTSKSCKLVDHKSHESKLRKKQKRIPRTPKRNNWGNFSDPPPPPRSASWFRRHSYSPRSGIPFQADGDFSGDRDPLAGISNPPALDGLKNSVPDTSLVYLVTGGSGFLGKALVDHLEAVGARVRVFDIVPPDEMWKSERIEFCQGDIRNFNEINLVCKGVNVIFHTASLANYWARQQDFEAVNVEGTKYLIAAALYYGVSQLIYTSSSSVVLAGQDVQNGDESLRYPERHLDLFSETKSQAEQYVLAMDGKKTKTGNVLRTCALRPHSMFGPGDTHFVAQLIGQASKGEITHMIGEGNNVTDFTYVDNVVYAHSLVTEKLSKNDSKIGGQAYFITNGEPCLFWDFVGKILHEVGCPKPTKYCPWMIAYIFACLMEILHWFVGWMWNWYPPVTRSMVFTMSRHHWFSHAKATRDFNYVPIVTLEDGLARTARWFKYHAKIERKLTEEHQGYAAAAASFGSDSSLCLVSSPSDI